MKVLTEQHISAAKRMPRKSPPLWLGTEEDKKHRRRARRERNVIAKFYRLLRRMPEEGNARLCHRHCVVTNGTEAKRRISGLLS